MNKFKNFTCVGNRGFKIAFDNDLVVSVAGCDRDGTECFDSSGKIIRYNELHIATFNQADLQIFNQITDEILTKVFCEDMDSYNDQDKEVMGATPSELVQILIKVSQYRY